MTGRKLIFHIDLAREDIELDLTVRWENYAAIAGSCEKTTVFGGKKSFPVSGFLTARRPHTLAGTQTG